MADHNWLEKIWTYREEELYPRLFGSKSEGTFNVLPEILAAGKLDDPRWTFCGVIKFFPTPTRRSWLYVSSGLSNAWFDERPEPSGVSGFGCEFVLETDENAVWPIVRLHELMVSEIGAQCGIQPNWKPLEYFDRFPLGKPIDGKDSDLCCVMIAPPSDFDREFHLDSGRALFYCVAGITQDERNLAKVAGGEKLLEELKARGAYPICSPRRGSIALT